MTAKKILMIIASRQFRDEEYLEPKAAITRAGHTAVTASSRAGKCQGKLGAVADASLAIGDVRVDDYAAALFIGGPGAEEYFNDPAAHRIAREALSKGIVLGAICIAPVILANAGLLKGRKATVFESGKDVLEKSGAVYTGAPVEADGRVITANGPAAAKRFAEAVLKNI